jgi:hypothetical protein
MRVSRRIFIRDGVATVTLGLSAPAFLSAIAQAQGLALASPRRRLPRRRQRRAQHAGLISGPLVLQPPPIDRHPCGPGAAGRQRCLRAGARTASTAGRTLEHLQRRASRARAANRYENSSRSHFEASDIWGTANPQSYTGSGWLGRYLDTLPRPLDALAAWNTTGETPRALFRAQAVCRNSERSTYTYASPNRGSGPWKSVRRRKSWRRTLRAAGRTSHS